MVSHSSSPATLSISEGTVTSVTALLARANEGQADAWDRIYALLYRELHRIAHAQLRARRQIRSPTSLIGSAWLKLAGATVTIENRMHLVGLMAHAMRYAILDEAKKSLTAKRGAQAQHLALDEEEMPAQNMPVEDLLQLDQALKHLAEIDPRLVVIVELRYFGGLTDTEIGELLNLGERTIRREWLSARSYLISHLGERG